VEILKVGLREYDCSHSGCARRALTLLAWYWLTYFLSFNRKRKVYEVVLQSVHPFVSVRLSVYILVASVIRIQRSPCCLCVVSVKFVGSSCCVWIGSIR
jgi:hypothetical protein